MSDEVDRVLSVLRAVVPKNATPRDVETAEALLGTVAGKVGDADWCELSCILAAFYLELPRGDRRANVERASALYRAVLAQEADLDTQVAASNGLANCVVGNPASSEIDFEEALAALEGLTPQLEESSDRRQLAALLGTRAALHATGPWRDRTAALGETLRLRRRAVDVLEADPDLARSAEMGRALHNLGATFLELQTGMRSDHVNSAVIAFRRALELRPAASDPLGRVRTQRALAIAYPEWTGAHSIDHAMALAAAAEAEAQRLTEHAAPVVARDEGWARFSSQTSALMADFEGLESHPPPEIHAYLDGVLANHQEALEVITPDGMPKEWALWKGGQGRAMAAYSLYLGRADYVDSAFASFDAALAHVGPEEHPRLWRDLQRRKGELAHACKDWARSHETHAAALDTGEALYAQTAAPEGRAAELRELRGFALLGAYAAAQRGEREAAVELAERGRSRSFVDAVITAERWLSGLPPEARRAVTEAKERVLELEARLRAKGTDPMEEVRNRVADFVGLHPDLIGMRTLQDPEGHAAEAAEARVELGALLATARRDLDEAYARAEVNAADVRPRTLSAGDISRLAEGIAHPIVYLLPTMHGTTILAVPPGGAIRTLTIEGFGSAQTDALLYGGEGLPGFLGAAVYEDNERLRASLEVCVPALSALLELVTNWLGRLGYSRASLIPLGSLGLLPLHAAAVEAESVYGILPSARVLANLSSSPGRTSPGSYVLFALAAPERDDLPDLPCAAPEAWAAADCFRRAGSAARVVASASKEELFEAAAEASHLHLACHAKFSRADPLASRVYIGRECDLMLEDLLLHRRDLTGVQLAVLSACQTAVSDAELPDESTGFPNALLTAGVRTVISTCWPVDDEAALLFSHRFYQELLAGRDAVEATQSSSRWLRNVTAAGVVAAAQELLTVLPDDAARSRAKLRGMLDYELLGSKRPFSDWSLCAAFACYGL